MSRNRKIIDFCLGFFGLPVFYWVSFFLLTLANFDFSSPNVFLSLAACLVLLLVIVGYGVGRRFIVIGALFFFGAMGLMALGSC